MPLPLGHVAIGLATFKTVDHANRYPSAWKLMVWIAVLANLPDIDVILGLMVEGNGHLFHRGPTHSLLFALLAGCLAARLGRLSRQIPRLGFSTCFLLVFSHVIGDMVLTSAPVSLLWPFEIHWSQGSSGWGQIAYAVIFESAQDVGLLLGAMAYIGALHLVRRWLPDLRIPVPIRRRIR